MALSRDFGFSNHPRIPHHQQSRTHLLHITGFANAWELRTSRVLTAQSPIKSKRSGHKVTRKITLSVIHFQLFYLPLFVNVSPDSALEHLFVRVCATNRGMYKRLLGCDMFDTSIFYPLGLNVPAPRHGIG